MLKNNTVLLSVNVNKIALLRNSRGEDRPHLLRVIQDCVNYGAQGITVHPRPDQRHIRYDDLRLIKSLLSKQNKKIEFNIEGYPSETFMKLVRSIRPHQVTLVPDPPGALTSNQGWEIKNNERQLKQALSKLKGDGIRTSLFMHPASNEWGRLSSLALDRVELFTQDYANKYEINAKEAIAPYRKAAHEIMSQNLAINAGHDLNHNNLAYFVQNIPDLKEVSIGHALICEALYDGLKTVIASYRNHCIRTI